MARFPGAQLVRFITAVSVTLGFAATVSAVPPPPGAWQSSCNVQSVTAEIVTAVCKQRADSSIQTALAYQACSGPIFNANGHLVCDKGKLSPGGSFRQSCRDIYSTFGNLNAACEQRSGSYVLTTLDDFPACKGDISNFNGTLRCSSGAAAPQGSYQQTCRDIWTSPHELHAACKTRAGTYLLSTLDLRGCKDAPGNVGGELVCNKGIAPPAGPYLKSCRDPWMDGTTLRATCQGAGDDSSSWYHGAIAKVATCKSPIINVYGRVTCDQGEGVPAGAYHATCAGIVRRGNLLSAWCRTMEDSWNGSTMSLAQPCRTDPYNLDGFLTCIRGDFDAPPGSYIATCRNIVTKNGGTLTATCRTQDHGWQDATLNLGNCYPGAEIWNQDGGLRCIPASAGNPPKNSTPPSSGTHPAAPQCIFWAFGTTTDCTNGDGTMTTAIAGQCASECDTTYDLAQADAEVAVSRELGCKLGTVGCCSLTFSSTPCGN